MVVEIVVEDIVVVGDTVVGMVISPNTVLNMSLSRSSYKMWESLSTWAPCNELLFKPVAPSIGSPSTVLNISLAIET